MNDPTFRLKGVFKTADETDDFEGPMILILQLLSRDKIEIQDIKISDLLDQYLAYLDEMKAMDLEITSEFVAMASHLVYLKAKVLLASGESEPTELEKFIEKLEELKNRDIYESIKKVTVDLDSMQSKGMGVFVKPQEYIQSDTEYRYVHDSSDILNAFLSITTKEERTSMAEQSKFIGMPGKIIYPVSDKEDEIIDDLVLKGDMKLDDLIFKSRSRTEIVATFVAVLELCLSGKIILSGDGMNTVLSRVTEVI